MPIELSACHLRLMTEVDLDRVLDWRNQEGVRNNMYTYHEISKNEHQQWWQREKNNIATHLLIAMVDEEAVGFVSFTRYTGSGGSASWAFYSGDTRVRGVGSLMETAALHYAFTVLGLHRLECEVLSFNRPVVQFHRKFGFMLEGVKKQAYCREGEYFDIYCLALLKNDWQFYIKQLEQNANSSAAVKLPKMISHTHCVSDRQVALFAEVINDKNPVHLNIDAAKKAGFDNKISHGMLGGSLFSGLFSKPPFGEGSIYVSQTLNFLAPVYVDDEIELSVRIISHIGRRVLLETLAMRGDKLCIQGEAVLMLPKL